MARSRRYGAPWPVAVRTWRHRRLASARRCANEAARCCRTRRRNTHGIAEREVAYSWHPWAGRIVRIHEVTRRGGADVLRCCLADEQSRWCLELPAWMFDRAVCAPMRLAGAPVAAVGALQALQALLKGVSAGRYLIPGLADASVSGAPSDSGKQSRRRGHATRPRPSSATNNRAARPVRHANKELGGVDPGVGSAAVSGALRTDRADDPPDPGARPQPQRNSSRGGVR